MLYRLNLLLLIMAISIAKVHSQDSAKIDKTIDLPSRLCSTLDLKANRLEGKLQKKTNDYLGRLEAKEKKLYKKLHKKDSILAKQTFGNIDSAYNALRGKTLNAKGTRLYSGHLDSLTTALKFIDQNGTDANPDIKMSIEKYTSLQQQFNASEQIRKRLQQRKKLLKDQFQKLGMVRQLKGYEKNVYYYTAQIKEYKKAFEDPSKMEQQLMDLVMKTGLFKDFFRKNSQLARMFAIPGTGTSATGNSSLAGLQTRASVGQLMTARFGSSATATQTLRDNVQSAQNQLSMAKNKISSYSSGSYGNGNADLPEFKPNSQKTKSLGSRLVPGTNFQIQRGRYAYPSYADLGLSLGFKATDGCIVGIGGSYKLGFGRGWDHIALTSEGASIRSYIDYKIRGNLYLSGGYEQNYLSAFKSIEQLKKYSAWTASGLIGVSKQYKVSNKFKGEMKLLWDFLSYYQMPKSQAIIFRVGYNLK